MVLAALFSAKVFGAASWTNSSGGFWWDGINWSGGQAPNVNLGSTLITNGTTKTVTVDALTPSINLVINSLTVAGPTDITNTLRLVDLGANNPLMLTNNASLTVASGGALSITNSSLLITLRESFANISFNVWAGSATLDSGSIIAREEEPTFGGIIVTRIGRTNSASLTINGGTMDVTRLLIAESPGSQFARSQGTVRLTGGLLSVAEELSIGDGVMCTGLVEMTGGQLVVANHQTNVTRIGDAGIGTMTVSNAAVEVGSVSVGRHDSSLGLLVLQPTGTMNCSDDLSIGRFSGATGTVFVAGGNLMVPDHPIWVGREGDGQMILSNGFVHAESFHVAIVPTNTARGLVTLAGGTTLVTSNFVLGDGAVTTGRVIMTGGQLFVTNDLGTAFLTLPSGDFTLNGGEVTADHIFETNAMGGMTFNGGRLNSGGTVVSNDLPFTVGDGTNSAMLHLLGGTHLFANGLVISSNATLSGCGTIVGTIINQGTIATNCLPALVLTDAMLNGMQFSFSFESVNNLTYTIEYKTNLNQPGWFPLRTNMGNGGVITIQDPVTTTGRFYQVRAE